MGVDALVVVLGLFLLVAALVSHERLHLVLRRPAPEVMPLAHYPSVTVVKPVRGLDVGVLENFEAALDNDYPGEMETIFVFDDSREPALPIARQVIAAHQQAGGRGSARIVIAGPPPSFRTGKLNAMIAGVREARSELIAFGDSDTRPDRQVIRSLVEKLLGTPGAGSAFAPVVVARPARTAGDVGAALLLNGIYGPDVALAVQRRGDMPFIMGQLMVFRRETLEAIGGLDHIHGELVDDMHIGTRVAAAGLRNVVAPRQLEIVIEGLSFHDFVRMFRRWLIFSRSGMPGWSNKPSGLERGLEFWLALLVTVAAVLNGHNAAAAVPALAVLTTCWSTLRLHRDLGGAKVAARHWWVPFGLILSAPFFLLSAIVMPTVDWRGRTYQLNLGSRLAAGENDEDDSIDKPAANMPTRYV